MKVNFTGLKTIHNGYVNKSRQKGKIENPIDTSTASAPSFKSVQQNGLGYKKVLLMIYDGWGIPQWKSKFKANPLENPCPFSSKNYPFIYNLLTKTKGVLTRPIHASGIHVGLPEGMVGSSEVGHNNLGAGRMVPQDLMIIDDALKDGSFFENKAMLAAMQSAKDRNKTLHLMGLLSDGRVHSDTNHLYNIIRMAHNNGVKDVRVHAFLDGRDVPDQTGYKYIEETNKVLHENGYEPVSSFMGMVFPMDRNRDWELKTKVAYKLLTDGRDYAQVEDAVAELKRQYANGNSDPAVSPRRTMSFKPISDGDSVIFFNYRNDRTIQLTDALTQTYGQAPFLNGYHQPKDLNFVCMSLYKEGFNLPIAFKPEVSTNTLTEIEDLEGNNPFRVCESEKYTHVTTFFDGKRQLDLRPGATTLAYTSEKGPTCGEPYTPMMQLGKIVPSILEAIENPKVNYILANFANADMIGHNNSPEDARRTIKCLDDATKAIIDKAWKEKVAVIGTADHGNIEDYIKCKGGHTNNPVGVFGVFPGLEDDIEKGRIKFNREASMALKDIAPTVLDVQSLEQPREMTGTSLLERKTW